ncbi:hypothetical protein C1646_758730 [Rhizophagus diaphanus]|nr:hypothetical protein C1646_758730 [Rhizophagus diaphanus] [Rhizophagus sp. MUCL 43196]
MIIPSSTKTNYHNRWPTSEGFIEYVIDNVVIEWTNELWNEMESYWNILGEDYEMDLIKWLRRFTNEIIFNILLKFIN